MPEGAGKIREHVGSGGVSPLLTDAVLQTPHKPSKGSRVQPPPCSKGQRGGWPLPHTVLPPMATGPSPSPVSKLQKRLPIAVAEVTGHCAALAAPAPELLESKAELLQSWPVGPR